MTPDEILDLDTRTLWHPYSAVGGAGARVVTSAEGVRLTLGDGTEVIDGMSSWWAAIHGYRNPVLDAAAKAQIDTMSHVMFGGLTHESAARLGELLVRITPDGLDRVFLADSGSVSIEVAVKTALQYWRARGVAGRNRLLTWRGGYHGDTFTPMSVCDPDGGMHSLWSDVLTTQVFAPAPPAEYDEAYVAELDRLVAEHAHELAAVIIEPVVQGAGGMRFHPPAYVAALREITRRHDVLLICDEIATGFGRTGTLFACDAAGITPDILCVGKALTGGYLTLAAMLCTDEVALTISRSDQGALMHGPTFMGNPLACAIAVASTELLLSQDWAARVAAIEQGLRDGLAPLRELPGAVDVRVLGAIGVVQLEKPVDMAAATDATIAAGVWLRPFRDLVYTMPPFISTPADVAAICGGVSAAVRAALQGGHERCSTPGSPRRAGGRARVARRQRRRPRGGGSPAVADGAPARGIRSRPRLERLPGAQSPPPRARCRRRGTPRLGRRCDRIAPGHRYDRAARTVRAQRRRLRRRGGRPLLLVRVPREPRRGHRPRRPGCARRLRRRLPCLPRRRLPPVPRPDRGHPAGRRERRSRSPRGALRGAGDRPHRLGLQCRRRPRARRRPVRRGPRARCRARGRRGARPRRPWRRWARPRPGAGARGRARPGRHRHHVEGARLAGRRRPRPRAGARAPHRCRASLHLRHRPRAGRRRRRGRRPRGAPGRSRARRPGPEPGARRRGGHRRARADVGRRLARPRRTRTGRRRPRCLRGTGRAGRLLPAAVGPGGHVAPADHRARRPHRCRRRHGRRRDPGGRRVILCVTGTSTGVGKTVATAALAAALLPSGPVTVVKPAQTGFADGAVRDEDGQLADAAEVARLAPGAVTVEHRRCPEPLAPLTAARRAGLPPLGRDEAVAVVRQASGAVLVEGAGGVLVRLGVDRNRTPFTLVDLAADLDAPVVVVADPALGTLNHTELTVRALEAGGVACAGIVLSRWPDAPGLAERCNLDDLPEVTGVPIVGRIPDGAAALPPARFAAAAPSWFDGPWLSARSRR